MTPSEQSYFELPLTQGQVSLVDAEDFERASQYSWHAQWSARMQSFYAFRGIQVEGRYQKLSLARFIMGIPSGSKLQVDHINQAQTLDNRKDNLRIATHAQNMANRRRRKAASKTGYRGVYPVRSFLVAQIMVNKKKIHLGCFMLNQLEEAARAYDRAALQYHGEFAMLNFPNH